MIDVMMGKDEKAMGDGAWNDDGMGEKDGRRIRLRLGDAGTGGHMGLRAAHRWVRTP